MRKFLQGFVWILIGFLLHVNELWSWISIVILLFTEVVFALSIREQWKMPDKPVSYKDAKVFLDGYDVYNTIKTKKDYQFIIENAKYLLFLLPRDPEAYYTKTGEWISWEDFLTRKKP